MYRVSYSKWVGVNVWIINTVIVLAMLINKINTFCVERFPMNVQYVKYMFCCIYYY